MSMTSRKTECTMKYIFPMHEKWIHPSGKQLFDIRSKESKTSVIPNLPGSELFVLSLRCLNASDTHSTKYGAGVIPEGKIDDSDFAQVT